MARALDLSSSLRTLSPRDRRTLLVGGVSVAILIVLAVILPLDHSVTRLQGQVAKKQSDLVWMRNAAPEIAAAGPVRSNSSGESLIVIVDQSARESGLGNSLAGSQPSGAGELSVQLEKAPFDALVGWLARLSQQNGVQIESATIDTAGAPGTVNATLVLKSP
jgi:general secretion pathway protein M